MYRPSMITVGVIACLLLLHPSGSALAGRIGLFQEDFESLPLGASVDEITSGQEVWTNVPPAGWTITNDIPQIDTQGIGVTEWKGWAFTDRQWWAETSGDQRRSEYVGGEGTIAVADPDEWDDQGDPKQFGLYNTWLKTAPIPIAGVAANSLVLDFASSWRPEGFDDVDLLNNQTAKITASFDGGVPQEILYWDSDLNSGKYHDHFTNEAVSIDIPNPAGASNVVLEFALLKSYNDWWWAIDNLRLTGEAVPEPSGWLLAIVGLALLARRRASS